ncbi:MAG TPA: hypothetical protein VGB83_07420 [Actinomycetota bacterium]
MAVAWDHRTIAEQRKQQNVLLRQTLLQMALGHVPFVRARLASAGIDARLFKGLDALDTLPLSMRRDVLDPRRNPEGPNALVLRGTGEGVKRFSDWSVLRRLLVVSLLGGEEAKELQIEAATRAVHVHLPLGPGGRLPVAYTRDDLDLLARAGARLAAVVGLGREDRLLNLVPFGPTLNFWGVYYMAHGVGMNAVHFRGSRRDLASSMQALDESRATVVALPASEAVAFPRIAMEDGIDISKLELVLAVGRSLTAPERAALGEGLLSAGARDAHIAAVYGPAEGRVLWGECSVPAGREETFGLHTYSDLDVVEVISPETGERRGEQEPGELVVTPLVFRGGGAPRWRTGDLALGGLSTEPCPNCGRTAPRVGPTVRQGEWRREVVLNGRGSIIDLRDAGAAASERTDHWQVELDRTDGADRLFVHVVAGEDPAPLIELYEDLARLGSPPTQVVLADPPAIERRLRAAPGPWSRYWDRVDTPGPAPAEESGEGEGTSSASG